MPGTKRRERWLVRMDGSVRTVYPEQLSGVGAAIPEYVQSDGVTYRYAGTEDGVQVYGEVDLTAPRKRA